MKQRYLTMDELKTLQFRYDLLHNQYQAAPLMWQRCSVAMVTYRPLGKAFNFRCSSES